MTDKINIVLTANLGFDYIMDFPGKFEDRIMPDQIHKISLSFLVDKLHKNFGGICGNIAYTLKLLGIEPVIVASAGNDFQEYQNHLKQNKISTEFIKIHKNIVTGSYFVITDQADNQIGAFYSGSSIYNKSLSLLNIKRANFAVISANDPLAMVKFTGEMIKLKIPFLYDPAFQIDNLSVSNLKKAIEHAQILIGNDYEIALIKKKLNLKKNNQLTNMVQILITTLGDKGSMIETKQTKIIIRPAKPRNTSDPTGAGDAYRAGFMAGFLRGFDLKTSGQMGSVAAVYTIEQYGTQTHKFTLAEFCHRYEKNFREKLKIS